MGMFMLLLVIAGGGIGFVSGVIPGLIGFWIQSKKKEPSSIINLLVSLGSFLIVAYIGFSIMEVPTRPISEDFTNSLLKGSFIIGLSPGIGLLIGSIVPNKW